MISAFGVDHGISKRFGRPREIKALQQAKAKRDQPKVSDKGVAFRRVNTPPRERRFE